jgi:Kef-type K+ transport system membrane component KefB
VTALAVVTKLASSWLAALSLGRRGAATVSVGMVPRGEVGIPVAGIGATAGVVDVELLAVIVGTSVLTTLAVPALRRLTRQPAAAGSGADGG